MKKAFLDHKTINPGRWGDAREMVQRLSALTVLPENLV